MRNIIHKEKKRFNKDTEIINNDNTEILEMMNTMNGMNILKEIQQQT